MDNTPLKITFSTHNVNGYKRSKEYLFSQCDNNSDSIRAIQEHWLRPPYKKQFGTNQLRCLHPDFDGFGTSAMSKASETRMISGRPFGGTGFVYHKKFVKCLKPLINHPHERVTALELNTASGRIIIINAYFPFRNSRDLEGCTTLYRDTVGHIDNIMHNNLDANFMILADFNCNIFDASHRFTQILIPLIEKYDLISAFSTDTLFDHTNSYTRKDIKTNSYSLIDGILISKVLQSKVTRVAICHDANNVSDHDMVEMDMVFNVQAASHEKTKSPQYVNWKKLSSEKKSMFKDKMTECLANIQFSPHDILHGNKCCSETPHLFAIENYFSSIVEAVLQAESVLPRTDPNVQRSFWNDDLMELKQASIDCNNNWKGLGRPRSGPAFECRQKCHYAYKSAIRKSKSENEKQKSNQLYEDLLDKNGVAFWKKWNEVNKVGNPLSSRINGVTDEQNIANEFASYFESVYSGSEDPVYLNLKEKFEREYRTYYSQHIDDVISPYYASWSDMLDIAAKIQLGKGSAGVLRPEHFIFGSPELMRHLQILFNGMIQHSYIPSHFLKGTISPIVKDFQGDVSSPSNYRGITLSCLPAKLFEFLIQKKTSHLLGTDELQSGFKGKTSTSHAIFTLQSTINHFNQRGS